MKHQHNIMKEIISLSNVVFTATFLIFFLYISPIQADNVVSSGTTIRISSGTFITTEQNVMIQNGATLTIEGSLILKSNLINQNTVGYLGMATIEFSGSTPQSLSGQNAVGNLVLNNPEGLDIGGNTTINTGLGLQTGHIRLGTNNLTLGSMATVTGTPSASAMVIATGTGELRKSFSGTGVFTYPVGDDSGTAEYSPITLNFTSGTFAADNHAGVKLANSAYPGFSGDRLNRYWSLTQNGITDSQYDAVFQYVPDDINGNENNIKCVLVEPSPIVSYNPANTSLHQLTASGLGAVGVFTGIATTIIQNISLNIGWNIISSTVIPANLNLKTIFQPMIDAGKLKKVMDEVGKTIENFGGFGGWVNYIGNLLPTEGFKVNVTAASTLSFEGTPVQLPFDINLNTGWNIISYPSANAQDAKAVFQALIDAGKLKKVMDESGKTIEDFGGFGGWVNNIGNLLPGKGYKVSVTTNCILTIPVNGTKSAVIVPEMLASEHFKLVYIGNGTDHMSINLVNLQASGLFEGDEIGIFDGKNCVGSATVGTEQLIADFMSIQASSNDHLSETIDGFINGNPIVLQLYRGGQTSVVELTKISGNELFESNGSLFATINANEQTTVQTTGVSASFKCFPNPFTQEITIEVQNSGKSEVKVEIYNFTGQLIKRLYQGNNAENLVLKWNGANDSGQKVAPGVYLCKMNGESKQVIFENRNGKE